MIDNNKIVESLRTVRDPNTGQDLVTARMVEQLKIDDKRVQFTLVLPSLGMAEKGQLHMAVVQAINAVYPEVEVDVHMAAKTAQSQQPTGSLPHVKNVIAVASGKGGVGKSTVSVNLALGLQQLGARVGILDADLYGPSIPTMLGLAGQRPKIQDVQGRPKIIPLAAYGMPVISIGFIVDPEQAVVMRGPRLSGLIRQFVQDVTWPPLDYLIVDLPPGTGDVQLSLIQHVAVTGAVLVTTPQEVAVVDAIKAMNMFLLETVKIPILGVVENMSWFTPAELPSNKYYIFGEGGGKRIAKMSNSMLLGQIPLVQSIREGGDEGKPAILQEVPQLHQAFMKVAKNTARQVALRNEMLEPTQIVTLKQ